MTDNRGRTARQDEVLQERRRRNDDTLDGSQAQRLAIPSDVAARLKGEGRTPRWINDEGNRLHNLTKRDDYDRVEGVEPIPVGTTKDGKPILSYLHSKPTAFLIEDEVRRDGLRSAKERALMAGQVPGNPNPLPNEVSYADAANKIERGSQSI